MALWTAVRCIDGKLGKIIGGDALSEGRDILLNVAAHSLPKVISQNFVQNVESMFREIGIDRERISRVLAGDKYLMNIILSWAPPLEAPRKT
jgi:hypothetical protein